MNFMTHGRKVWGWNSDENISEEPVYYYHAVGNHELEEAQVNNDLGGNQLGNLQYKLGQRNGKFRREVRRL